MPERFFARSEKKGSAAVAMIVSLSVLLWLGGMLTRLMGTETDTAINFRDGIAAQYMAEAGLRRALVVLYNSGNPSGLTENISRDGLTGSYRITSAAEGASLRVRSVGQVGAAKRSVSVLVAISLQPDPGLPLTELSVLGWGN